MSSRSSPVDSLPSALPSIPSAVLSAFLDEALPAAEMATLEAALRADDTLRDRLAQLIHQRDAGLHSLGDIWRRGRLTCPSREQLGSLLLGALPDEYAEYVQFHLTVIQCRYCAANLADLESHAVELQTAPHRRAKYFQSSVGRLKC